MKKFFLVGFLFFSLLSVAQAGPTKQEMIRELVQMNALASTDPDVLLDGFTLQLKLAGQSPERIKALTVQAQKEFADRLVAIYDKQLSSDEVKALHDFHRSKHGARIKAKTPAINEASLQAASEIGTRIVLVEKARQSLGGK